jgi:predicted metalloendopeptidase
MNGSRALLLTALVATMAASPSAQNRTPPRVPGIDTSGMDLSVRPQDDFFRYMNGTWADKTPIPGDMTSYGTFAVLRDRAQEAVRGILEAEAIRRNAPESIGYKIGAFYKSFTDEARIEALGLQPLEGELAAIDQVNNAQDLTGAFVRAARSGVAVPLAIGVGQDPQKSDTYTVLISQAGLGMPDRDYYLRNDERFVTIRAEYTKYVTRLFELARRPDPAGTAARVIAFETRIAERQWDRVRNRDRNATYNKMPLPQLQAASPHINWTAYFSESTGHPDLVREVVVRQPDYLAFVDALIAEVPIGTWKEYLTFKLLRGYASDLPKAFVDADFAFNDRVIAGRQEMQPRWKRGVATVEATLGDAVGRIYVERYFKPEAKARMDALIRNLQAAFRAGIDELEWMSPETKKEAQAKLAKYSLKIGYPERWRDFSALAVDGESLIANELRFLRFQHNESWARLGKPVERWRWGFTPQTVNASYSPANNEITFPAGILQPPFFDVDADDAINYGAIGAVIGHEISHGFDDQGRKSDGDGNLRDWWTADDAARFEERARKLGAQFAAYSPLPGMNVNPGLTMGENIGDLSGLAVAYRAYRMSLNGKTAPVIGGVTGDQRFFMGWAQVWRFKSRDEALRNQLLTDSHSPGMIRAFAPLTNIDAFYTAFDVKPGDKLYRAPEDRVRIW